MRAALLALAVVTASSALAEDAAPPTAATRPVEPVDPSLSPECRVPGSKLYTLAKLGAVKAALAAKRPLDVLSIGTSSAGLATPISYPARLESALERALPSIKIAVEARTLPGEVASGAGEGLRTMVAETEPDLVVWQVGTNDALARVDADAFGQALGETVEWVKSHGIDVVLIDPLFTESVAQDETYNEIVKRVREVAAQEAIPLVRRYEAMRFLASGGAVDADTHMLGRQFRLNDLGLRCMAEHVTRAITLSLLQPEPRSTKAVPGAAAAQTASPPSKAATKPPAE